MRSATQRRGRSRNSSADFDGSAGQDEAGELKQWRLQQKQPQQQQRQRPEENENPIMICQQISNSAAGPSSSSPAQSWRPGHVAVADAAAGNNGSAGGAADYLAATASEQHDSAAAATTSELSSGGDKSRLGADDLQPRLAGVAAVDSKTIGSRRAAAAAHEIYSNQFYYCRPKTTTTSDPLSPH